MKTFREFYAQQDQNDKPARPWKATKQDVLDFWTNLQPNSPILPEPVPESHRGTKFGYDGVRITGKREFINGVMSRIQDLIKYETLPGTRLEVEYRQIQPKNQQQQEDPRYVFYVHVIKDEPGN